MYLSNLYSRIFSMSNIEKCVFVLLCITSIGMPLSPFVTSIGTVGLIALWLISGNWQSKIDNLKQNRQLWPIAILLLIHLIWLFNTSNFKYAAHDINIKMPLLIFPLVIGSIKLTTKRINTVLQFLVFATILSSIVSTAVYFGIYVPNKPIHNIRDISIFISHIRLGLMTVFSICVAAFYLYRNFNGLSCWKRIALIAIIAWLLFFTVILQSLTSWVIALLLVCFTLINYHKAIPAKYFTISLVSIVIVLVSVITATSVVFHNFYVIKDNTNMPLPETTSFGNAYFHDTSNFEVENGFYINRFICRKELEETWNELSIMPFNGKDLRNQDLNMTIIRYLTSKGLTKDRSGLMQLTTEDIKAIEAGNTNCLSIQKSKTYQRIYETIWEFDDYIKRGNPNGKSICMRIEYLKTGWGIFKKTPLLGVGTGDVCDAFRDAYVDNNSNLDLKYRNRAHNQYVTFSISFGIIGLILVLICFFSPLFIKRKRGFLLSAFALIIFISMLNEDTLETQAGVTLFAFIYTLLLSFPIKTKIDEKVIGHDNQTDTL